MRGEEMSLSEFRLLLLKINSFPLTLTLSLGARENTFAAS
jgi:hypothetical protein